MRLGAIALVLSVGASAHAGPKPPAQTRDVEKLALPPVPLKGLCMVERSLTAQGEATMQLVYANEGKLLRREQWNLGGAEPEKESWIAYSWADGRLIQAADQNDHVIGFRYDAAGRLAHVESPSRVIDLAWSVKPIAKPQRIVQPHATMDAAMLPLAQAFEGSVEITMVESGQKSVATERYEPHGNLVVAGCEADARGRPVTCKSGSMVIENRWDGDQLIEVKTHRGARWTRETYTYDGDGRVTAIARAASSDGKRYVVDERTRYEYRCAGGWIDDPIGPAR